jgi:Tfp pilus assembly protein FimT
MTVVLIVGMILIAMAALAFSAANTRMAARSAAQLFSRDLALARSMAVRAREKVTVKFTESGTLQYTVTTASGRSLASRTFGPSYDVNLSAIDLATTGDSLVFSTRGVAALSTATGTATFTAGGVSYQVTFNAIGASAVGAL